MSLVVRQKLFSLIDLIVLHATTRHAPMPLEVKIDRRIR